MDPFILHTNSVEDEDVRQKSSSSSDGRAYETQGGATPCPEMLLPQARGVRVTWYESLGILIGTVV